MSIKYGERIKEIARTFKTLGSHSTLHCFERYIYRYTHNIAGIPRALQKISWPNEIQQLEFNCALRITEIGRLWHPAKHINAGACAEQPLGMLWSMTQRFGCVNYPHNWWYDEIKCWKCVETRGLKIKKENK